MILPESGFYNFIDPPKLQDPYLQINCIGVEERNSTAYYFDNSERHLDSLLFQYTLSGQGILEIDDKIHPILPEQAFFISLPGNSRYYLPKPSPAEPWRFIFILIQGEHVRHYYNTIVGQAGHIMNLPWHNKAIQTLISLYNQAGNGQILHPFYASELAYRFLCQLGQTFFYSPSAYSVRTQSAIQIMEHNYASLNSIEELAAILEVSLSHFTREFSRETGVPPIRYLTNIRLQQASRLLQETILPINEIAVSCGFSSGNYFTRCFRKQTDMTPVQFRTAFQTVY